MTPLSCFIKRRLGIQPISPHNRPTGCEYLFNYRIDCQRCKHYSESRYWASFGRQYLVNFWKGMGIDIEKEEAST